MELICKLLIKDGKNIISNTNYWIIFFEPETNQMVRFDVIHAINKVNGPFYVTDPNEVMFVNQWAKTNPYLKRGDHKWA
jgi:hypothetical protein